MTTMNDLNKSLADNFRTNLKCLQIFQKKQRNIATISALASKMGQIKKTANLYTKL